MVKMFVSSYVMLTEQWPIFLGRENRKQIHEQMPKGALNLAEIQHQNGHGNHMGNGLPQL